MVRLAQPLWVCGECADPAVGRFAGLAAALHVSSSGSGSGALPVIRYCVIDETRQTPVWVEHTDVHETRWLPGRAKPHGPDAPILDERQVTDRPPEAAGGDGDVIIADSVEAGLRGGDGRTADTWGEVRSGEPRSG